MTRVTNLANFQLQLNSMLKTRELLSNTQQQVATKSKTSDFKTIASDSNRVINLAADISRASDYNSQIDRVTDRIKVMELQVNGIKDVVAQFKSLLNQYDSGDEIINPTNPEILDDQNPSIASEAVAYLQIVQSDLNTTHDGRYLFSGQSAQKRPVDVTNMTPLTAIGVRDSTSINAALNGTVNIDYTTATSYYTGGPSPNQTPAANKGLANSFTPSDGINLNYGISADDPAFAQVINVLNVFSQFFDASSPAKATIPPGSAVTNAIARLQDAEDALTTMESDLGSVRASLDSYKTQHTNVINLATNTSQNLLGIDDVTAATQLSLLQTQLQASYSAFSNVSSLSLVNFLK
jgi:flagellar hook-associated protein 3 FlgL